MTMKERMARAMYERMRQRMRRSDDVRFTWENQNKYLHNDWLAAADAVLDALNHPTQAVLNAGGEICANDADELDTGMAAECLNAMICAIKDGK